MNDPVRSNADTQVIDDFGKEWSHFDQSTLAESELRAQFERYFSLFPSDIGADAEGFDLGCGSGRWARLVAPRVGRLHCIDPASSALAVAAENLSGNSNCEMHLATVDAIPLEDGSMDFGYSLGVLHHVPDTQAGIRSCVKKLKPGAPFLVYLYYAFDNRPVWFKALWRITNLGRLLISRLPHSLKLAVCQLIALVVYWPLSRIAAAAERTGVKVSNFPLSHYRDKSLYTLRTDALDRFGTRLEQRFTQAEMRQMMTDAGLERIQFRDGEPYWCAIGYRAQ